MSMIQTFLCSITVMSGIFTLKMSVHLNPKVPQDLNLVIFLTSSLPDAPTDSWMLADYIFLYNGKCNNFATLSWLTSHLVCTVTEYSKMRCDAAAASLQNLHLLFTLLLFHLVAAEAEAAVVLVVLFYKNGICIPMCGSTLF